MLCKRIICGDKGTADRHTQNWPAAGLLAKLVSLIAYSFSHCSCTGPLANMCVEEHNWGGCWRGTIGGKFYTSCKDDVRTYRSAASQTPEWYRQHVLCYIVGKKWNAVHLLYSSMTAPQPFTTGNNSSGDYLNSTVTAGGWLNMAW